MAVFIVNSSNFLPIIHQLSPIDVGVGRVVLRCWVNLQCRGVLLIWITVGEGPIVLAVGAGGGRLSSHGDKDTLLSVSQES